MLYSWLEVPKKRASKQHMENPAKQSNENVFRSSKSRPTESKHEWVYLLAVQTPSERDRSKASRKAERNPSRFPTLFRRAPF